MKQSVVFLGRGELGMQVLQGLLTNENVDVKAVFTCRHSVETGQSESAFQDVAEQHGLPFHQTNNINKPEWKELLESYEIDLAVAMLWLHVINPDIIGTSKRGFLNLHGGLLPRYRGNACCVWAMLNGEKEMGITAHLMEGGKLDSGPIILQETLPLTEETTFGQINDDVRRIGAGLILRAVDILVDDPEYRPESQDESQSLYCYPRIPRDGEIDWNDSAHNIEILIRAVGEPFPGAYTWFTDVRGGAIKKMIVHSASVEAHPTDYMAVPGHLLRLAQEKWAVACGDKQLLVLKDVQVDDERGEPGRFFRTVRQRLGLDISTTIAELTHRVARLEAAAGDAQASG